MAFLFFYNMDYCGQDSNTRMWVEAYNAVLTARQKKEGLPGAQTGTDL